MATNWMSRLVKDFGVIASEMKATQPVVVPSWSPSLNWATTLRGFMPGKVNIAYGPESAGKSLLAQMAIIELQRRDSEAISIWFDTEFSFNIPLFEKLGGDSSRLIVRKSNDPLKIFDYIGGELLEMLQDGAPVKAIVIDSIKAIRYPKDIRKHTTDQIMGGSGSAYLGSALKLIIPVIAEFKLLTFFVQQVSAQIDPMKAMRNPYVITEGHALKHAADLMLEITRLDTKAGAIEGGDTIAGGTAQVGHKVRIKVRKNRMGIPARVAQFTFNYEKGITDTGGEIFDLAKSLNIIG
jgi:RecA/RadA recombinase